MNKRHPGFHKRRYIAKVMQAAEQRLDRERPDIYPAMREYLRKQRVKELNDLYAKRRAWHA